MEDFDKNNTVNGKIIEQGDLKSRMYCMFILTLCYEPLRASFWDKARNLKKGKGTEPKKVPQECPHCKGISCYLSPVQKTPI